MSAQAKTIEATAVTTQSAAPAPAVVTETSAFISMLDRAARDPAVDMDKMERLLAMHEKMLARKAEDAFNDAMSKAQAEMQPIVADKKNSQTKSRYASYAQLDRAVRPIYSRHGFSLSFNTEPGAPTGEIRVVCFASCAGHTRKYQADMPADGKGAKGGDVMTRTHAAGSGMTYGQRYLLKLIFNLAISDGEDDDGNAATSTEKINNDELTTLRDIITVSGANELRFLQYMTKLCKREIGRLEDIPASHYDAARSALENFSKRSAK